MTPTKYEPSVRNGRRWSLQTRNVAVYIAFDFASGNYLPTQPELTSGLCSPCALTVSGTSAEKFNRNFLNQIEGETKEFIPI